MKRSLLVLMVVVSACGGTTVDTSTPEALHESWIAAAQAGDAETLNTMVHEGMQAYRGIPEANTVEILRVDDSDYEEYGVVLGVSTWDDACYIGTMMQINGEWVMDLWREYPMEQCTE